MTETGSDSESDNAGLTSPPPPCSSSSATPASIRPFPGALSDEDEVDPGVLNKMINQIMPPIQIVKVKMGNCRPTTTEGLQEKEHSFPVLNDQFR